MTLRRLTRSILIGVTGLVIVIVVVLGSLIAFLWVEHRSVAELPAPTGTYAVGRTIYGWRDASTPDSRGREFRVWIWYPAVADPAATPEPYLPAALRAEVEDIRGPLISNFLTRDLSRVRTHSFHDADVSQRDRSYPVLLMRGGASAAGWNYSALGEDLASHGYVVAGLDVPDPTPEDNPELCLALSGQERDRCVDRVLGTRVADLAIVLDRLAQLNTSLPGRFVGRLDMSRVGLLGHSFGGATALQFCRQDSRCKAGIDLDGAPLGSVVYAGLQQPFMFLLSDHSRETDPESLRIMADIGRIYDRLPANGRSWIAIAGAHHFTFSDDGALLKSHVLRGILRMFGKLRIAGRRQLAATTYCIDTFFDAYLKERRMSPLELASPRYPEIQVLK